MIIPLARYRDADALALGVEAPDPRALVIIAVRADLLAAAVRAGEALYLAHPPITLAQVSFPVIPSSVIP